MIYTELPHYSHPEHKLQLVHHETPYKCDGCMEMGFGVRYRCEFCNFDLHKDCMFATSSTSHDFYEESVFKFFDRRPGERERYCDACVRDVQGFVYHCDRYGHDLHPCCRNLPCVIEGDGVKFRLQEKVSSKCRWCGKRELRKGITGWAYVSKCKKYHIHVSCVKDMLLNKWEQGYFFHGDEFTEMNNLAVETAMSNLQLTRPADTNPTGGRISKYWRIMKLVVKTIVSIILGDPTAGVVWLIESLVSQ